MIQVIPAIDIIDGRCVRLEQGDFERQKTYFDDPVAVAQRFEDAGFTRLHIVDLDGAKNGRVANLKVLEQITANTILSVDFGGGIKTDDDIEAVFSAGAAYAGIGSIAVKEPELFRGWLTRFGGDKILLGADVRDRKIAIDGWQTPTEIEIVEYLRGYAAAGIDQAFVTDISKDGLLAGSAEELYAEIVGELPGLRLIASGGVSSVDDILALDRAGCAGVIVGKAFYEGRIDIEETGEEFGRG